MVITQKTAMKVNTARFMEELKKENSNMLSELVKNGLEAEGSTCVKIWLNRDMRTLKVFNDGMPFKTAKEFEKLILEIFTTGKNKAKNYGKGFSSVLAEKFTRVETGHIIASFHSWDNIEIKDYSQDGNVDFVEGTTVMVTLREDSPLMLTGDVDHEVFLSRLR